MKLELYFCDACGENIHWFADIGFENNDTYHACCHCFVELNQNCNIPEKLLSEPEELQERIASLLHSSKLKIMHTGGSSYGFSDKQLYKIVDFVQKVLSKEGK